MFAALAALLLLAAAPDADRVHALLRADRWQEALALAERLDDVGARAAAEFRAGRLGAAYERLAAFEGEEGYAAVVRARLEAARGQVELADAHAERAVAAAPDRPDVLYWAADVVSDRERARRWLGRFLELADDDQPAARLAAARGALATLDRAREAGAARWVGESLPARLELPLAALPDGRGGVRGWTLTARLGERKRRARLLLDSGTHGLTLVRRIAERGGLTASGERELVDLSGRVRALRGVLPRLALGELVYRDAWVTAVDDELDPTGRFAGLVGISLFSGYRLTLDPRAGRLTAERAAEPLEQGPRYWWVAGHPLVEVELDGVGARLFVLDTGAPRSVVAEELVSARGTTAARTVGGESRAGIVDEVGLRLGQAAYRGPALSADFGPSSAAAGVEISGLVGLDVYGRCRLAIDGRSQRLALDCD